MTDSSATQPPGWYYAQGDPPGTQRYWDGSQWVGGPQAAQGAADAGGGYAAQGAVGAAGRPAEFGSRLLAWLIDAAIVLVGYIAIVILLVIGSAISDALGSILALVGYLALFGFVIWNSIIRQGSTGQTIGKSQQNIKLVADSSGQPVGGVMAFVRLLVASVLSICFIVVILDYLWPLWDAEKKRLTDKILNFSVVDA